MIADSVLAQDPPSTTGAPGAEACPTLDAITKALIADRAAVDQVLAAPPETRSIADAIIVWNSDWSAATTTVDAPLGEVRAAVLQSLGETADHCLDEPIAGPRLIPIPAGSGTVFLVFGSGNWRWRQLLTNPGQSPEVLDTTQPAGTI